MEQDFLNSIIKIYRLLNQLLNIYKINFKSIYSELITTSKFDLKSLKLIKFLILLLELNKKIINISKQNGNNNVILALQRKFIKELQLLYANKISFNKINIGNLFKKYLIELLDLVNFNKEKQKELLSFIYNLLKINTTEFKKDLFLNKELLSKMFNKNFNSLECIARFLIDLINNEGYFIPKYKRSSLRVGKNLATTPGKVVYKNTLIELIRYTPTTKKVDQTPLLFIPSFINKYYILDLSKNNSLVRWMVGQGIIVYIISWINPKKHNKQFSFSYYMTHGLLKAIDFITIKNKFNKVHLAGYCIGGTLLSCTLAYMKKLKDNRVLTATYLMSLTDFSNLGNLSIFVNKPWLKLLRKISSQKGYLDGRILSMAFNLLKPFDLILPYIINYYFLNKPIKQSDLLYWNYDITNLPTRMYMFYLNSICYNNKLIQPNKIKLNNIFIDLTLINVPSFCLAGTKDHITIWQSVYNSSKLYNSPIEFVLSNGGHIKGVINPPINIVNNNNFFKTNPEANKHIKSLTPEEWLINAKINKGSWWSYWRNWLKKFNKKSILVENITDTILRTKNLPNAPGSYVI